MPPSSILLLRRHRDDSGQVFVLLALILIVLLGMAALVLDVGYAYYVQRSLQASADAAALAGAQELPDAAAAKSVGLEYGANPSGKNRRSNVPGVTTSVTTKCVAVAPCRPVNAVVVTEVATVPTRFARVLGIDTFTIHARATACSPCSSAPVDVMLVLDRTGSMCQDSNGNTDPACTDLNNARNGMKTFLAYMDPAADWVGLAVLPPARSVGTRCSTPLTSNYDSTSSPYVIVPLSSDYSDGRGNLNYGSNLVSTIECQKGGGRTAYANALESAQAELESHGRPGVPNVIVFLSDGAANIGPTYYRSSSPYRRQPCHQGVWSAATIKSRGTTIYSIGYDLDAQNGGANRCESYTGALESPSITATSALQQIASDSTTFFNKPDPGQLGSIYSAIASDITGAALIPD